MKNSKAKFVTALVISLLAEIVSIVAVILMVVNVGADAVLASLDFNNIVSYLSLSKGTSLFALLPLISVIAAGVFLLANLVLTIVKKKWAYLAPTILSTWALVDGALGIVALASEEINLYSILVLSSLGLGVLAALLTFIFLLMEKKNVPVKEAVPFVAPAMEEEDKEEEAPIKIEEKQEPIEETREEEPVEEEVAPIEKKEESKPVSKKKQAPAPAPEKKEKVLGKYEIFPEAGFYKYRLMANNGEILIVSNGYKTREGARSGVDTLKKNVEGGISKVITDKNGYSQFRIFTPNDSRLVASGEFYASVVAAQKALASVERFYKSERIIDLDDIAEEEEREWKIDLPPMNPNKNGKFEVFIEEESKKWQAKLIANNGAVLFITTTYSSKTALLNALANIKNKVLDGNIDIARDKMNRYHFHVISENGSILLMGETYPSRDSAISAAVSVRNFIGDAKVLDLTK